MTPLFFLIFLLISAQNDEFCRWQGDRIVLIDEGYAVYRIDPDGSAITWHNSAYVNIQLEMTTSSKCPDADECAIVRGPDTLHEYLGLLFDRNDIVVRRFQSADSDIFIEGTENSLSVATGNIPDCGIPTINPSMEPTSQIPSAAPSQLGEFLLVTVDFPVESEVSSHDEGVVDGILLQVYEVGTGATLTTSLYGVYLNLVLTLSLGTIESHVAQLEDLIAELSGVHRKFISYEYSSTSSTTYDVQFEMVSETFEGAGAIGSRISSIDFISELESTWDTIPGSSSSEIEGGSQIFWFGEYYINLAGARTLASDGDYDAKERAARQQIEGSLQSQYDLSIPYPLMTFEILYITPQPVVDPTRSPSTTPSSSPSSNPTFSFPSTSPQTSMPSVNPVTGSPSTPPTGVPSDNPSSTPSSMPSDAPIIPPSAGPTFPAPTEAPWDGRTAEPTLIPSFAPTVSGFICEDTPGWDNGYGMGCDNYEDFRWCTDEGVVEWSLGETYNFPETNCCICGRERTLLEEINTLQQEKREVEGQVEECYASSYNEERVYATDIILQKEKIREIQNYIEDECFNSEFATLSSEVRRRLDAIKKYVEIATQNLIRASQLPAQNDLDKIQQTYFEYVLDTSHSCDITDITYDELVIPTQYEDAFQACLLFCAYSSTCSALQYQYSTSICRLLHSIPTQATSDSDFECMSKHEDASISSTTTLEPNNDLCLCYSNAFSGR